jgi:hydrogenase/urease accessory protein HupE
MRRLSYLLAFLCLVGIGTARADITNPATLAVTEISPSQFRAVLTLPIINGRVLKARLMLPDIWIIKGDLDERSTAGSVIRTWQMECNPEDLAGAPIGISGLLGTMMEIQLTIETLDGRKYVQSLHATQSYYVIPPPPSFGELALDGGRKGMEQVLQRIELFLLVVLLGFIGLRTRTFVAAFLAFAAAQALGQWLAGQNWAVMSAFLPQMLTALTSFSVAYEILRGKSGSFASLHRPLWVVMLLLGFLYGATPSEPVAAMGLSRGEQTIAFMFVAVGAMAGLALLALCVRELRAALFGFFEPFTEKITFWIGYTLGIVACALFLYHLSTPAFTGVVMPIIPGITWVAVFVLAVWAKLQSGLRGSWLAVAAGALFAAGIFLSFSNVTLPLTTLVVFGFLAFLGTTLLFPVRWPGWLLLSIVGLAMVNNGYFAGLRLRDITSLPVANVVGMGALLAFLFYACYRATPAKIGTGLSGQPVRLIGLIAAAFALLWRLAEYREWFSEELSAEIAMGFARLPVLAVFLLLVAGFAWPRKRRFDANLAGGRQVAHWVLIAVAFFALPLGTLRVHNPFYTPRAPSTTEATHIMDRLLTDTYLAFNLKDENESFDNLETNLSQDLVADVYLDSRRRLTAGTRQGAKVTVKDVSVISLGETMSDAKGEQAFTYPCKWVVTARVQHLKHIHDRQNIYLGELTIGIEDDRWKITRLVLKSEERVIKSWQIS